MRIALLISAGLVAAGLIIWSLAGQVKAETSRAGNCVPYERMLEIFAEAGWVLLPDVEVPGGYEVDRLMVMALNGEVIAAPVFDDCVPQAVIPLGLLKPPPKGEPA